jgi:hypothetical protein
MCMETVAQSAEHSRAVETGKVGKIEGVLPRLLFRSGRGRARQGDSAGADVVLGLGVAPGGKGDLGLDAYAFGVGGAGGVLDAVDLAVFSMRPTLRMPLSVRISGPGLSASFA